MSAVEVVVGSSRLWLRAPTRHGDAAFAVVQCSDGSLVAADVVDEPGAVPITEFLDSSRIGLQSRPPAIGEAIEIVMRSLFDSAGIGQKHDSLTVVCPTYWGASHHTALRSGLHRLADEITTVTVAERVAELRQGRAAIELIVVAEVGPLSITLSAVERVHAQVRIVATEFEPTLGAQDAVTADVCSAIGEMLDRVLGSRRPTSLVFAGDLAVSPPLEAALIDSIPETWGSSSHLGEKLSLVRLLSPKTAASPAVSASAAIDSADWVGSLRERAAVMHSRQFDPRSITVMAATAVTLIAVGIVCILMIAQAMRGSDGGDLSAVAEGADTSLTAMHPASSTAPTSSAPPLREQIGRIAVTIPPRWRVQGKDGGRLVLGPDGGAASRITVIYNTTSPGFGYGELVADLAARIDSAPPGRFGGFERDLTVSGRPGATYRESPGDGSEVLWQVLFYDDVQVSVGCQTGVREGGGIDAECDSVVRSVSTTA
ncbi:type VII secretion-associated protein [Nocardia asteroides]|uniref:type VII secretion-associated protein n=1 Tax=Nocardia asteroides TaxID=1824 RepID=UPI0037C75D7A